MQHLLLLLLMLNYIAGFVVMSSFEQYRMPIELWNRMKLVLPKRIPSPEGGRPPKKDLKRIADGIFYKLKTGCQWKSIPTFFGSSSTIHRYFQKWVESNVFEKLWELALEEYDDLQGINWRHQALDTSITKAPLGGEKNRTKPNRQRQVRNQTLGSGRRKRNTNSS